MKTWHTKMSDNLFADLVMLKMLKVNKALVTVTSVRLHVFISRLMFLGAERKTDTRVFPRF